MPTEIVPISRRQTTLLILTALAAGLWGARSCFALIGPDSPRDIKHDLDCIWLLSGIEPTHTFSQTLHWWTGPWCYDLVPYYRPTSSLFFWLEYKAFGPMGLQAFTAVHLLSHLIMMTVTGLFLACLLGWRRALPAIALYGVHSARVFGLGDSGMAFPTWKDGPDVWCGICYIASLWLFTLYVRSGRRKQLILSLVAFAAAITFKEMAYTLPASILLILWYEGKLRAEWKRAIPYFGLAAVAALYRFWALSGPGFRNGTNGAWLHRTIVDLAGPPGKHLATGDWLPIAIILFAVALWSARRPEGRRTGIALGVAALLTGWNAARLLQIPPDEVLYAALVWEQWVEWIYVAVFTWLLWRFVRNRQREQLYAYGWVVVTHAPLMTMPVGEHGFYLVAIGWAIWLGASLDDVWQLARPWWARITARFPKRPAIAVAGRILPEESA